LVALRYSRKIEQERFARQRAHAALSLATSFLNDALLDTASVLAQTPNSQKLEQQLLEKVLAYYESVLELAGDDPHTRLDVARGYRQLGRSHRFHYPDRRAERDYERAISILEQLITDHPSELEYQLELMRVKQRLGNEMDFYREPRGLVELREALELGERLVAAAPDRADLVQELYLVRTYYANHLQSRGEWDVPGRQLRRAVDESAALAARYPSTAIYVADWAYCKAELANHLYLVNRLQDAEREVRQALEIVEPYQQLINEKMESRVVYGLGLARHGRILRGLRQLAAADAATNRALQELEPLMIDHPTFDWGWQALSNTYNLKAEVSHDLGRYEEAIELLRKAITAAERAWESAQRDPQASLAKFRLGQVLWWTGQREAARLFLQESLQSHRRLAQQQPVDRHLRQTYGIMLLTCPDKELCDVDEALRLAQENLDRENGQRWQLLGAAQYYAKKWQDARQSLEKSLQLRHGGDAFDYFLLAMICWQLEDRHEARQAYDEGVARFDKPIGFATFQYLNDLHELRAEARQLLGVN
jgi:tetratricopeptide (TPR) repeat protein